MSYYITCYETIIAVASFIYFYLIGKYVKNKNIGTLMAVILINILIIYLYCKLIEMNQSGAIYAVINGLSVVLVIMCSYFGGNLRLIDILGAIFIIIGVVIVGKR